MKARLFAQASWTIPVLGISAALFAALIFSGTPADARNISETRFRSEVFSKVRVLENVRYGVAPGKSGEPETLRLDLYRPVGDKRKRRPVVIWLHGGGFEEGDKSDRRSVQMARNLARRGYVAASVNYRLLGEGCPGEGGVTPQCFNAAVAGVNDVQASVRFFRAKARSFRIDPGRIAVGGESAGAIAATGVGVLSSQPGESGNPGFRSDIGAFVSISGGLPGGLFVDELTAPGLFFAGTEDDVIPYAWSTETRDAMREFGIRAPLVTFEGGGHVNTIGPGHDPWRRYPKSVINRTSRFIFNELDPPVRRGNI